MKRKTPKSILYKEHFAKVIRLVRHAEKLLYCPAVEKIGIEWTDEEKKKLHDADRLATAAQDMVSEIFAARIGKQAIHEAKIGE